MKRIDLYVTDSQLKILNDISITTGIGKSEIIRRALDAFIDSGEISCQTSEAFSINQGQPPEQNQLSP